MLDMHNMHIMYIMHIMHSVNNMHTTNNILHLNNLISSPKSISWDIMFSLEFKQFFGGVKWRGFMEP